jgi:hypothetical protein
MTNTVKYMEVPDHFSLLVPILAVQYLETDTYDTEGVAYFAYNDAFSAIKIYIIT